MPEYLINRKPKSRLVELASKIKVSAGMAKKIIEIPQDRFVCQNREAHGKIKTVISFGREKEHGCSCGIIYRRI